MIIPTLALAILGGVLPAFLWLWFYLQEDRRKPEPRGKIMATFVAGALVVFPAILIEQQIEIFFPESLLLMIALWAITEEILKFGAAYVAGLRAKEMNEPIDGIVYLITAALGFAALENALFLLTPIADGLIIESIVTGNLRFIGAMILHTFASGVVGSAIALSYYKRKRIKREYIVIGLVVAIALHALFNFFIIQVSSDAILGIFLVLWIATASLLLLFEKAKRVHPS